MKKHIKNNFHNAPIALMGFTAVTIQIVLMRELAVVFYGNEVSLGAILGIWLIWTAVGSTLIHRRAEPEEKSRNAVSLIQIGLALVMPFLLMLVRMSRILIGNTLGELIGFIPMLAVVLIVLAPFCILSGRFFPASCRWIRHKTGDRSVAIGNVYLWESVGSGIGGILISTVMIQTMTPASIVFLLSSMNLLSALFLSSAFNRWRMRNRVAIILFIFSVISAVAGLTAQRFQRYCDRALWKGHHLISTQNTIYGNLTATRFGEQINFFQNGLLMYSTPDRYSAEESVHFGLLEHPAPETVLLIGGGTGGALREITRHPSVREIHYVELDPQIIATARNLLPEEQSAGLRDPRITIHLTDGRRFIKSTRHTFDVIILNLPNPYTAQLNRFYTVEFFREAKKKLSEKGVLSFSLTSSENVIGPELSDFLTIMSGTFSHVFREHIAIPGEICHFIGANTPEILTSDPEILIDRLKKRGVETHYISAYYLPARLSEERQAYLAGHIRPGTDHRLNRDFKPVGYYFDTILWATTHSAFFKNLFLSLSGLNILHVITALVILSVVVILTHRFNRKSRLYTSAIQLSIAIVGFTEISLEVVLILGFQVLFGHMYQHLALIIAGYMIGLTLGSYTSANKPSLRKSERQRFKCFQVIMCAYPVLILYCLKGSQIIPMGTGNMVLSVTGFICLAAGAGFIGGFQFPLANRLYLLHRDKSDSPAGYLYGIDLLGSSAGALTTSAFLIPLIGIEATLLLLALLNFWGLVFLQAGERQLGATPGNG